nr:hypothetical protein BaRGS_000251 [Batillaria attramentaria]
MPVLIREALALEVMVAVALLSVLGYLSDARGIMEPQKLVSASESTAAFFESQLTSNGELKNEEVAGDLAAQYKLPTLLLLTGRGRLAHKVLDNLKQRFLQPDGDLLSFPDKSGDARKSDNEDFQRFWLYMNGWVAMAAHRLGRFDISVPARGYLEKFYNSNLGGYGVGPKDVATDGVTYNVDVFMSAHLGLLSLYFGGRYSFVSGYFDLDRAIAVGNLIGQFVAKQPDLKKHFLVRMHGDSGVPVQEFPASAANFLKIDQQEPSQLYFLLGYPVFYLYYLSQATGDSKFLQTAESILDFLLTCDKSMYSFFLSHKAAFGAGLVAQATGKMKYRDMAAQIVSHLLSLQGGDGEFLKDLPTQARLDQSAEIAIWLRELANNLTSLI